MNIKKLLSYSLALSVALTGLVGCTSNEQSAEKTDSDKKLKIVTTIFPEYDWVSNILGEKTKDTDLVLLMDSGIDMHSFQPSADDMITVSNSDLFIYTGGLSDAWVSDALKNSTNSNIQALNLIEVLGQDAKTEEVVEGMQDDEHDHDHDHDDDHDDDHDHEDDDHDHETEIDEHVWLSLKNAEIFCKSITDKLCSIDPENAQTYKQNSENYIEKLKNLDGEYKNTVQNAKNDTLLFGDRFPFRYLTDDYDIDYYAAFVGCSTETNASFDTISFLANRVDELNLKYVITIENSDQKVAKTIIENTKSKKQEILTLDSMQSINKDNIKNGVSYLSIMEKNLEVLKKALN